MSISTVDTSGLDRLQRGFGEACEPQPDSGAWKRWSDIIDDDNRKGVLGGYDKNGNMMMPVTYRPKTPGGKGTKLTVSRD